MGNRKVALKKMVGNYNMPYIWSNYSDLTQPHPKWWFSREIPLFQGNLGWWNIRIWQDTWIMGKLCQVSLFLQKEIRCTTTWPGMFWQAAYQFNSSRGIKYPICTCKVQHKIIWPMQDLNKSRPGGVRHVILSTLFEKNHPNMFLKRVAQPAIWKKNIQIWWCLLLMVQKSHSQPPCDV